MSVARPGGLDAAFLALENPLNRLHVMATMVLDPSTVSDGFSADRFVATLADRRGIGAVVGELLECARVEAEP